MDIQIETQGFSRTPAIDEFTRTSLKRALRSVQDHVVGVDVFLGKSGGSKGANDLSAALNVRLRSGRVECVEAVYSNLYAAIGKAVRRARRSVKRVIAKQQRRRQRVSVRDWDDRWLSS